MGMRHRMKALILIYQAAIRPLLDLKMNACQYYCKDQLMRITSRRSKNLKLHYSYYFLEL